MKLKGLEKEPGEDAGEAGGFSHAVATLPFHVAPARRVRRFAAGTDWQAVWGGCAGDCFVTCTAGKGGVAFGSVAGIGGSAAICVSTAEAFGPRVAVNGWFAAP